MTFLISQCLASHFSQTEGEGNGKKLSKKKAAEKMMDELKKLPPLSPVEEPPNRVNPKVRRKQQQLPVSDLLLLLE